MHYSTVKQAVQEALGPEPLKAVSDDAVVKRAKELEGKTDNTYVDALREAIGPNVFSLNVAQQVIQRVKDLEAGSNKPPFGVEKVPAANDSGPLKADINAPYLKPSILGDEKNINAQQHAAFEKNPDANARGSGGNAPAIPPTPVINSFNPTVRNDQ